MNNKTGLKILYVSSEVSPYAKTGGLADVAGSLPKALARMGHDIRIVMPRYQVIKNPMETILDFPVSIGNRKDTAIIRKAYMENMIPVYFIDNYQYFDRANLYVHDDEPARFAFFCRAVLEMLPGLGFQPDIIHCNDWHSGPICVMLKEQYKNNPIYQNTATLFTIHNLHYQGNFSKESLRLLGLSDYYFHPERLELFGDISFIKAGLVYADIINTVSKSYAEEIQTEEFGEGLEGLLRKRSNELYGIINGIDDQHFNPAVDPYIYTNFSADNIEAKKENKFVLQEMLQLPVRDVPVIGLVSRLTEQKGLDLVIDIFDRLMNKDIQFVLVGSGDEKYESYFNSMKERYPDKVGVNIGFNVTLAQQVYAGCDIFLMPSRFEPCGLGQLIALRYGTIPLVRATGGLADTVINYDPATGQGNGFVFHEYSAEELLKSCERALNTYQESPNQWNDLIKRALQADFSWLKSAWEYEKLYKLALGKI